MRTRVSHAILGVVVRQEVVLIAGETELKYAHAGQVVCPGADCVTSGVATPRSSAIRGRTDACGETAMASRQGVQETHRRARASTFLIRQSAQMRKSPNTPQNLESDPGARGRPAARAIGRDESTIRIESLVVLSPIVERDFPRVDRSAQSSPGVRPTPLLAHPTRQDKTAVDCPRRRRCPGRRISAHRRSASRRDCARTRGVAATGGRRSTD